MDSSNSVTIESLQLELNSNAGNASNGLTALAQSLEKIKKITGSIGLTGVIKQLNSLNQSVRAINSASIKNLDSLARAMQLLSGVGRTNLNSAINQLNRIPETARNLNSSDMSGFSTKIRELADALRPLSEVPKQNISSALTQLKKLPDIFEALQKLDMNAFSTKIKELSVSLQPLANEMNKIASGFSAFPARIQRLIAETNRLSDSNTRLSGSYIDLWARFRMAYNSVMTIGTHIASAIEKMNDYIENLNLFTVSMGEFAQEAQTYAQLVGETMGIDPGEWMRNQGVFMTLATGFGVAGDRAYIMSKNLTQLGYDLSSFFNITFEESMQKLQSGISGELEPLRRLGFDLSQARLEAVALSLGIDKSVDSMTQAEKAQLRYYAIMTQVTTAQGDMARTLEAPANQLRILSAQVTQAARAIGSIFIPVLNAVLPYITAFLTVVRELAEEVALLAGFEMPEIDYSGVQSVAGGAEDAAGAFDDAAEAAKKFKSYTMGIDELNVISPSETEGANGTGTGGIEDYFDFELPEYDFLGKVNNQIEKYGEQIKKFFSDWGGLLMGIAETLLVIKGVSLGSDMLKGLESLLSKTGSKNFKELFSGVKKAPGLINKLSKGLLAAGGLAAGLALTANGARDLYDGLAGERDSVASGVISLIGGIGANAAAGLMLTGSPIGALIGGLAGVAEGFLAWANAENEYRRKALTEAFFDGKGQSIAELTEDVTEALEPLQNYTQRMEELNEQSKLAGENFDTAYDEIVRLMELDLNTAELETLKELFADLAQSAQDMADANFGKIFESLNSAVDEYLTNDALEAIKETSAELAALKQQVTGKISNVSQRANEILEMLASTDDPMSINVGKQQLAIELGKLQQYADVEDQVRQENKLQEAVEGVNFGSSASDAISSIGNIQSVFSGTETSINDAFKEGKISLDIVRKQADLMGIDITDQDYQRWLTSLTASRDSQLQQIAEQREKVKAKLKYEFRDQLLDMIPEIMGRAQITTMYNNTGEIIHGIDPHKYEGRLYGTDRWQTLYLRGPIENTKEGAKKALETELKNKLRIFDAQVLKYIEFDDGKTAWDIYDAIQKLASGGFVGRGQLFVAREAGPELVGSIGGRTAVANNEQIVSAVSEGVAQAVASVINPQENGQQINLNVYLDGEQITAAVERTQSRQGMKLLRTGGY